MYSYQALCVVVCVVVMCLCIVKLLWGQCMHAFHIYYCLYVWCNSGVCGGCWYCVYSIIMVVLFEHWWYCALRLVCVSAYQLRTCLWFGQYWPACGVSSVGVNQELVMWSVHLYTLTSGWIAVYIMGNIDWSCGTNYICMTVCVHMFHCLYW